MKVLGAFALALCLFPLRAKAVIVVTEQISKVDFEYFGTSNGGTARATLASSDGSLGGTFTGFQADFSTDHQVQLTITAPAGMKFVANLSQGARLDVSFLGFNQADFKEAIRAGTPSVTYSGLSGTGGAISGGNNFALAADGSRVGFGITTEEFSPSFAFQSVSFLWTYDPTGLTAGIKSYLPTSGTIDFNALNVAQDPGHWLQIQPVPEPSSLALFLVAATLAGSGRHLRRRLSRPPIVSKALR